MHWKQYLTPVKSIDAPQAKQLLDEKSSDQITLLDVRQPKEYRQNHIPGAKLIPLPDLLDHLNELDPEIPIIVHCAVGARSRVAAQLLAGRGYDVLNLSGGIKAWQGHVAVGDNTAGLSLFSDKQSVKDILIVAYSLEQGLEDFYLSMADKVRQKSVRDLFAKLSSIEAIHRDTILLQYQKISNTDVSHETFAAKLLPAVVEGGLSTKEYLELFKPDLNSVADVISLAMSIEAQALDLYERAIQNRKGLVGEEALRKISSEERAHLRQLGKLMDDVV